MAQSAGLCLRTPYLLGGMLARSLWGLVVTVENPALKKAHGMQTPYYLIDKSRLLPNLEKIAWLREASGAKCLLALKCFATWSVFDFMSEYMDGSTSSSLYEVRLGHEKFSAKPTHIPWPMQTMR